MTKTINYVLLYPDGSAIASITKTDNDGPNIITQTFTSPALTRLAAALFAGLQTEITNRPAYVAPAPITLL